MKRHLVLVCLVAGACASNSQSEADKDPISATAGDWSATISPRSNSTVRGEVKLQSAVVGSAAKITITGGTPGAVHPWHVHTGTCDKTGGIVGSVGNYPVLTIGADGSASANAAIGSSLAEGSAYAVNVHRSPTDMGTIVGCGDLKN